MSKFAYSGNNFFLAYARDALRYKELGPHQPVSLASLSVIPYFLRVQPYRSVCPIIRLYVSIHVCITIVHNLTTRCGTGPRLNIKSLFPGMLIPMLKTRRSYIQYGDPYTSKKTSLYWDGPCCGKHTAIYVPLDEILRCNMSSRIAINPYEIRDAGWISWFLPWTMWLLVTRTPNKEATYVVQTEKRIPANQTLYRRNRVINSSARVTESKSDHSETFMWYIAKNIHLFNFICITVLNA